MNLVPLEAQLLILAVLFYIYDSSVLLFSNEGVITPSWKNWSAQTNPQWTHTLNIHRM